MCEEKCFEAEKQEVLSIISHFSMLFQAYDKHDIFKKTKQHAGKENLATQPQVSTCKILDMITHHTDVVTNSYCTEWAHKKILKVLTNTPKSVKLVFKIPGLS